MAAIRGEITFVIGVIVSIVSLFNDSLTVFIYLGVAMAVYGLAKVVYRVLTKPKAVVKPAHHNAQHHQHQTQYNQQHPHHAQHTAHHQQQSPQHHQSHKQYHPHSIVHKEHTQQAHTGGHNATVKKCPNCQSVMPTTYRHCPSCGFGF